MIKHRENNWFDFDKNHENNSVKEIFDESESMHN